MKSPVREMELRRRTEIMRMYARIEAEGWWQARVDACKSLHEKGKGPAKRDIVWPDSPVVDMEGSLGSVLVLFTREHIMLGKSKSVTEALGHWRRLVEGDDDEWARVEAQHPGARELYRYGYIDLAVLELPYRNRVRVVAASREEFPPPSVAAMRRWLGAE